MDWSNIGIAIFTGLGTVISIYKLFQKKFEKIDQRFEKISDEFKEVRNEFKEIRNEFKEVRKEISHIENKVSNIEGQMIQMTRPIYKINSHYDEEPKEN